MKKKTPAKEQEIKIRSMSSCLRDIYKVENSEGEGVVWVLAGEKVTGVMCVSGLQVAAAILEGGWCGAGEKELCR